MDSDVHNDIGDLFYKRIDPLSQTPQQRVWEGLEQQLNQQDAARFKQKFVWYRAVALLLLILLLGLATFTALFMGRQTAQTVRNPVSGPQPIAARQPVGRLLQKNKPLALQPGKVKLETHTQRVTRNVGTGRREPSEQITQQNAALKVSPAYNVNQQWRLQNLPPLTPYFVPPAANLVQQQAGFASQKPAVTMDAGSQPLLRQFTAREHRFALMAFVAPEWAGYHLEDDEKNRYDNRQLIEKRERQDLSVAAGILLSYKISKRFTLQSGLTYALSNISITPSKIYAEASNTGTVKYRYNTSSGFSYLLPAFSMSPSVGDSLYTRTADHQLQYISLPAIVKYSVVKRKFAYSAGGGFAINYLARATLNTEVTDLQNHETETATRLEGLHKLTVSAVVTPELQYALAPRWRLSVAPVFKYALRPINKGTVVKTYPYSLGLNLGALYKF